MNCDQCGAEITGLAFSCNECGKTFCSDHRLPEAHDCIGVQVNRDQEFNKKDESRFESDNIDQETNNGSSIFIFSIAASIFSKIVSFTKYIRKFPASAIWKTTKFAVVIGLIIVVLGQAGIGPIDSSPQEVVSPLAETVSEATEPSQLNEREVQRLVREGINDERADRGLTRLSPSANLQEQAEIHSVDMAEHDELAHNLPGSTTNQRLSMANCNIGGENVAQSWYKERVETSQGEVYIDDEETLADTLVTQWMNSPEHRENLLRNEWSETGVAIETTDNDKVYATQLFCES